MNRDQYIDNIEVERAKTLYKQKLNINPKIELVEAKDSLGRITSEAIFAVVSSPSYTSAAMDGIQVNSSLTEKATEREPLTLTGGKDFEYINTGYPVKEPFNSVIMIEDVIIKNDKEIEIISPSYPYQHVRQIGEDIVATEMILPSRHKIRPMDIGALVAGGIEKLSVSKKPTVGIVPTGSEIVTNVSQIREGKIIDSNSHMFKALVEEKGGIAKIYPPMEDNYNKLKERIQLAVKENDMVLINAGSSAGSKDYTVDLIKELGEAVIHGVAMKPGKPTILGIIDGKPVIGVPGYPVSAFMVFDRFIADIISDFTLEKEISYPRIKAKLTRRVVSSLKNEELIRVNVGKVNENIIATPLSTGAGVSMSLVRADGIALIPRNVEGLEQGEEVEVELLKPFSTIEKNLISIGSHDLCMDILSDMLELTSSHVGSMGGILAIKRGECHLAPIHLLDEETGEYNISYVKKYFKKGEKSIIKGVQRTQGFIVAKGNPLCIETIKDLTKEAVILANRQRGAGTRVLLDYLLNKGNIDTNTLLGYQRELTTHMAVAAAVYSGSATVGVGVYSAAKAMGLDFVPLAVEEYDFLVDTEALNSGAYDKFLEKLKSQNFKEKLEELGGYGFERLGEVIAL